MGTNYYAVDAESLSGEASNLHIGKSSGGWCFGLHVVPSLGLNSWNEWYEFLVCKGYEIQDEYGGVIPVAKLVDVITKRKGQTQWDEVKPMTRTSFQPYDSWAHFHKNNHSQEGPSGLLRHKLDPRHCVGHGDGTWDLMTGEFC